MTDEDMCSPSSTIAEVAALGEWAARLRWEAVPGRVREQLATVLFDVLAANIAGADTAGQHSIRAVWHYPPGHSPIVLAGNAAAGSRLVTDAVTAAFLNGQATVCLELDEGNKYAKGHPAAHCFPAIVALAAEYDVTGPELARALLTGYEIAARFGNATSLHAGAHPHGNWGVAGAAAGCAQILGLDGDRTAAAIDAGSGLPIAGHFNSALDGNSVRDSWVGVANQSGIAAARLAAAGAASNTGTAAHALGHLLGTFDPTALRAGLEDPDTSTGDYFITCNYFKRHAACSYTHPVADAAIELRNTCFDSSISPETIEHQITDVRVDTHVLAAPLHRTTWHNSLSAMFSVPFVAAASLLDGKVSPRTTGAPPESIPLLTKLARRVRVHEDNEFTQLLPGQRGARVTLVFTDGHRYSTDVPNPIGDTDFAPFDRADLSALYSQMPDVGPRAATTLHSLVDRLDTASSARSLLMPLSSTTGDQEPAQLAVPEQQ